MNNQKNKSRYRTILQISISVILFYLLLGYIDVEELRNIIINAKAEYILLIVIVYAFDRVFMAWKWNILLGIYSIKLRFYDAFKIYYMSCFLGFIFPLGVGPDIVRFLKIKKYSSNEALAATVMERFLGMVASALMVLVSLALLLSFYIHRDVNRSFTYLFIGLTICVAGAMVFVFNKKLSKKIVDIISVKKISEKFGVEAYYRSFSKTSDHKEVVAYFTFLSFLEQLMPVLAFYFLAKMLSISMNFIQCLAVVPISIFLQRLPVSFHGIGVREGSYVILLRIMNVGYSNAFALGILNFFMDILSLIPAGILYIYDSLSPGINVKEGDHCEGR